MSASFTTVHPPQDQPDNAIDVCPQLQPLRLISDYVEVSPESIVHRPGAMRPLEFWKMSLISVSPGGNFLCIAVGSEIHVYQVDLLSGVPESRPIAQISPQNGVNQEEDSPGSYINYLRCERICNENGSYVEVCVAVDGLARVWFFELLLNDLSNGHTFVFVLDNSYHDVEDSSTWSLSFFSGIQVSEVYHAIKIAVGSNSHRITLFELDVCFQSKQILRLRKQCILGHNHNIPSVSFSPCGNFLASCSIDGTLRTWKVHDGKEIKFKQFSPQSHWGWSVCWLHRKFIKKPFSTELNMSFEFANDVKSSSSDGIESYLLLHCNAKDIFILDAETLRILWHDQNYLSNRVHLEIIDRLIYLEVLPELGAVLCGSSGGHSISISRIFLDGDGICSLSEQVFIPKEYTLKPLCGMTVTKALFNEEVYFSNEIINSRIQSSFWRVYILFADGTCTLAHIRRNSQDYPYTISLIL